MRLHIICIVVNKCPVILNSACDKYSVVYVCVCGVYLENGYGHISLSPNRIRCADKEAVCTIRTHIHRVCLGYSDEHWQYLR